MEAHVSIVAACQETPGIDSVDGSERKVGIGTAYAGKVVAHMVKISRIETLGQQVL
jgi:hypothetical protein